jgi:membrane protease YdiL (CAAX protease family)
MRNPKDVAWLFAVVLVWFLGAALSRRWGIWPGIGGAALLLAGLLLALKPRTLMQALGRHPLAWAWALALGAAAGLLMTLATYALYPLGVRLFPGLAGETASLYGAFGTPTPARILLLIAVVLAEELIWRGWVQGVLTHRLGPWRGTLLAACVYALAHAPAGSPLLPLVALACGLGWGALRQATASLAASITAHLLWDLAILAVWPLTA